MVVPSRLNCFQKIFRVANSWDSPRCPKHHDPAPGAARSTRSANPGPAALSTITSKGHTTLRIPLAHGAWNTGSRAWLPGMWALWSFQGNRVTNRMAPIALEN